MTERRHLAQRLGVRLARAGMAPAFSLVMVAGLGGCHRKIVRPALPLGSMAPIELETPLASNASPEIATLPPPELGPLPPPPPAKPVPRRRPTPAPKEETQPPAQVASAEPAALAIGALSSGGDQAPQSQQQARDLIGAILKRISALPAKTADANKKEISQVSHFLEQAQKALNSGDAEGAINLATKAKLLMDDLEKR